MPTSQPTAAKALATAFALASRKTPETGARFPTSALLLLRILDEPKDDPFIVMETAVFNVHLAH